MSAPARLPTDGLFIDPSRLKYNVANNKLEIIASETSQQENSMLFSYFTNLGVTQTNKGQYYAAETSLNKSIELNPDWNRSYGELANTLMHQKRDSEAMEMINKALKIQPEHRRFCLIKGMLEIRLGNMESAEELILKAYEMNPKKLDVKFELLKLYYKTGKYQNCFSQILMLLKDSACCAICKSCDFINRLSRKLV